MSKHFPSFNTRPYRENVLIFNGQLAGIKFKISRNIFHKSVLKGNAHKDLPSLHKNGFGTNFMKIIVV